MKGACPGLSCIARSLIVSLLTSHDWCPQSHTTSPHFSLSQALVSLKRIGECDANNSSLSFPLRTAALAMRTASHWSRANACASAFPSNHSGLIWLDRSCFCNSHLVGFNLGSNSAVPPPPSLIVPLSVVIHTHLFLCPPHRGAGEEKSKL